MKSNRCREIKDKNGITAIKAEKFLQPLVTLYGTDASLMIADKQGYLIGKVIGIKYYTDTDILEIRTDIK